MDLLFPAGFVESGISEDDFRKLRDRETIKSLFEAIGFRYKIGKFNAIYNRAKEICPTDGDRVNVRHFQMAMSEMHSIE